jgi:hypothetical protein
MRRWNHIRRDPQAKTVGQPMSNAKFPEDCASQFQTADNRVAPASEIVTAPSAIKTAHAPAAS